MNRRDAIQLLAAIPAVPYAASPAVPRSRVRPSDPSWPSLSQRDQLREVLKGSLHRVVSPLDACRIDPNGPSCQQVIKNLHNPYYLGDQPGATQIS
jgi:hypothetical protein